MSAAIFPETAKVPSAANCSAGCSFDRHRASDGPHSVHQCRRCGHAVTLPAISDVSTLYSDRDTQDYQGEDGALVRNLKRIAFDRQARGIVRTLPASVRTAYDFGVGSGVLTAALARAMPGVRLTALDFFETPPPALANLARYRSFEDAAALPQADLVTAFHVLEHDDDPVALLERMARLCRPGGALIVEVPNADTVGADLFGRHWDNWYLPYHRVHFSETSLRRTVAAAGLQVTSLRGVSVPSVGRSLARLAGRPNGAAFVLAGAALHPIQRAAEVLTGRPTALRATLLKPAAG